MKLLFRITTLLSLLSGSALACGPGWVMGMDPSSPSGHGCLNAANSLGADGKPGNATQEGQAQAWVEIVGGGLSGVDGGGE